MSSGRVVLVGAGPGDPELITVKGFGWLRRADVVVYDRLVAPALLEEAPAAAVRIYAGKARGRYCIPQSAISALLIHHAGGPRGCPPLTRPQANAIIRAHSLPAQTVRYRIAAVT